ncbi:hypothetical protein PIB30_086952 [Stylosanthes scabra]|uniref:Uncharacterized protein n=1 Tax=Stylosanthes scabra TaxID=79078 RepID=A0ABU6YSI6_9FABA|nr:hypothetical protein [Stylosanthes scabra]
MRGIKNTPKNSLNYLKTTIDPNGESMLVSSAVPPSYWSNWAFKGDWLHKQLRKLHTQRIRLRTQPADASSIACAVNIDAHTSCNSKSPKLKARSGISSLGA